MINCNNGIKIWQNINNKTQVCIRNIAHANDKVKHRKLLGNIEQTHARKLKEWLRTRKFLYGLKAEKSDEQIKKNLKEIGQQIRKLWIVQLNNTTGVFSQIGNVGSCDYDVVDALLCKQFIILIVFKALFFNRSTRKKSFFRWYIQWAHVHLLIQPFEYLKKISFGD